MTTIRAAIFDMDGLLLDSEPFWQQAEIDVLGRLGVPLTPEMCEQTKGLRIDEVITWWRSRYPWTGVSNERVVHDVLDGVAERVASHGRLLPGVEHALQLARRHCERVALASSSPMSLISHTLQTLGIRDQFDIVRSAEHEAHGKPHPAVYLSTAAELGISPLRCLAFEDSMTGVIAAKAARMVCVAVPDPTQRNDPRFTVADLTLDSLEQFDEEMAAKAGMAGR